MTLFHKFLVSFTWATSGYIWGTAFFAFHSLFQRRYHCPCHQCLCLQHHWCCQCPWCSGIFSEGPRAVGAIATSRVTLLEGPPPTDARFPVAAGAAASRRPGLQAPPLGVLPGDLGLRAQLPQPWGWDQQHCLCCSPDSTASMWKIHSPSHVQLCVCLVSWCVG